MGGDELVFTVSRTNKLQKEVCVLVISTKGLALEKKRRGGKHPRVRPFSLYQLALFLFVFLFLFFTFSFLCFFLFFFFFFLFSFFLFFFLIIIIITVF